MHDPTTEHTTVAVAAPTDLRHRDGGELAAVLELWRDADTRGWSVTMDPGASSWRARDPDHLAGISYDPSGPGAGGVVGAYDTRRTLALTGVDDAVEAVGVLRAFLGWPTTRAGYGSPATAPAGFAARFAQAAR